MTVVLNPQGKATSLRATNDGALYTAGAVSSAIPDNEDAAALLAEWGNFSGVNTAGGDFVATVAGLNGQTITALSASPLTVGESFIVNSKRPVIQPCAMEIAASFVRTGISFATASLFANDPILGPDTIPTPINIVSYYQSSAVLGATNTTTAGTVMHMLLETALPAVGSNQTVFAGDWINITGLVDSRFNYPNACINYISPDRKTIAVGFSDESALPSLVSPASGVTTPTLGTAKVNFYNNFSGARNAFGLRLTGTTATSAAVVGIFGGDDNQVSGALLGDHRVTIGSTAPTYVAGAAWGQAEIRASTRFMLECTYGASVALDKAEQSMTAWISRDVPRTSVKPATGAQLLPRFRLYKPISMTRPVAKVVSATHAAASNVTAVTLDVAPSVAGLQVGNYVTLRGVRDQTNFANSATGVAITAINEGLKQITIAWGSAAIATSYGGSVILQNGSKDQPGIIGQVINSAVSRVTDGASWLDLIGNAAWSGLNIGDYVELHGVRVDLTGADLGMDGAWEVAHISTTTLVLKPIYNIFQSRVTPAFTTLASTNCGGSVILRPTLRSHDLYVPTWSESIMGIRGQGTSRADLAIPVNMVAGGVTTVTANMTETNLIAPASYSVVTAASTNAAAIKATAGNVYELNVSNLTAASISVKLYNKATAPTVGTDIPLRTYTIVAGGTLALELGRVGARFATGIAIAVTALPAATDTTVVTAGAQIHLTYI